ncbi:oleosin-B6-like [Oxyura jamaicensis]|uniref:oleosin-B6-like n=1 Tax=Oxyura jamaicensis TaxID=8884 RepID=UPI0015A650C2|nr:oleosin-B6-like [Oxyura jamaicensis]
MAGFTFTKRRPMGPRGRNCGPRTHRPGAPQRLARPHTRGSHRRRSGDQQPLKGAAGRRRATTGPPRSSRPAPGRGKAGKGRRERRGREARGGAGREGGAIGRGLPGQQLRREPFTNSALSASTAAEFGLRRHRGRLPPLPSVPPCPHLRMPAGEAAQAQPPSGASPPCPAPSFARPGSPPPCAPRGQEVSAGPAAAPAPSLPASPGLSQRRGRALGAPPGSGGAGGTRFFVSPRWSWRKDLECWSSLWH